MCKFIPFHDYILVKPEKDITTGTSFYWGKVIDMSANLDNIEIGDKVCYRVDEETIILIDGSILLHIKRNFLGKIKIKDRMKVTEDALSGSPQEKLLFDYDSEDDEETKLEILTEAMGKLFLSNYDSERSYRKKLLFDIATAHLFYHDNYRRTIWNSSVDANSDGLKGSYNKTIIEKCIASLKRLIEDNPALVVRYDKKVFKAILSHLKSLNRLL